MANGTCGIDGCGTWGKLIRGWCCKHYNRWLAHGDPLFTKQIRGDDERRFWSHVNKNGPVPERRPDLGPCWVWTSATDHAGYGVFQVDGHSVRASRYVCEITSGPIPDGHEADHLCFNPPCVNYLSHLEVVTGAENNRRSGSPSALNAAKTRCLRDHEFTPENTRVRDDGSRSCKECERLRPKARRRASRRAENRACQVCGADIGHRSRHALYCEDCARIQWRAARLAAKGARVLP